MDADRFDALARSLSATPSRRGALRLLVGSAFGGLVTLGDGDADAHNALTACKKKSGKQKKKCLKKAKKHNASHTAARSCTPSCTGKTCGDNGCGGSCGTCTGGTCSQTGVCDCGSGKELCRGACVSTCTSSQMRPPGTCNDCCYVNGTARDVGLSTCVVTCCSGHCNPSGSGHECTGRAHCEECTFDEQCANGEPCAAGSRCGLSTDFC
jgi:hypothetical protein